mmetsp:Transcript_85913/g.171558  ORF Transcript_85913/g.171558 Transcript_85913/m.171558 type:complete len:272 (-) Transcript_85913:456-1271(-)
MPSPSCRPPSVSASMRSKTTTGRPKRSLRNATRRKQTSKKRQRRRRGSRQDRSSRCHVTSPSPSTTRRDRALRIRRRRRTQTLTRCHMTSSLPSSPTRLASMMSRYLARRRSRRAKLASALSRIDSSSAPTSSSRASTTRTPPSPRSRPPSSAIETIWIQRTRPTSNVIAKRRCSAYRSLRVVSIATLSSPFKSTRRWTRACATTRAFENLTLHARQWTSQRSGSRFALAGGITPGSQLPGTRQSPYARHLPTCSRLSHALGKRHIDMGML